MEERIEGVRQNLIGTIANEDVVYVELERCGDGVLEVGGSGIRVKS